MSSDSTPRLTRRAFVRAAMGSVGVLAAGGATVLGSARRGAAARPGAATRNWLHVPPEVFPDGALTADETQVALGGGTNSAAWAYNRFQYSGFLPGPTFRATRGNSASILFTNGLPEPTSIHWHGMVVETAADGHPLDAVAAGATYPYQFPIRQRACLNWYHPHPDMRTGPQVAFGLAGAFIVNDTEEAGLGLPSGPYEVPLIVRDAKLDSAGNLTYTAKGSGFLGNTWLVNGTLNPKHLVDATLYRFRVVNGANARIFRLALGGAPLTLIGNDGGLLTQLEQIGWITIAPGERIDFLIDFTNLAAGASVMLKDLDSGWDLLQFVGTGALTSPGDVGTMPTGPLSSITPLFFPNPEPTRVFHFDGMSRINGKEFDLTRIDFEVPFGQTERWRFNTGGNAPHPVHVHGASFQVVSRTGGRNMMFPWEQGWKDTVLLEDGETVDILIRFEGSNGSYNYQGPQRGLYLLHCHKLEHEDNGMMANFVVV